MTAILLDRERDPRSLRPMVACSLALHAVMAAVILIGPARWVSASRAAPRVVMSVSLGSVSGPSSGGASPLGGRAVQRAVPEPEARREPDLAPAARTPEMTVPSPAAKTPAKPARITAPPPEVKQAPEEARSRTPTTGAQEQFGSSFAETGVNGLGVGLSTGGDGAGGALDIGGFCCPEYLGTMARRIKETWNARQGVAGISVMRFTVQRDGRITEIGVEQSAGYVLDLTAQGALQRLRQLPPLPAAYTFPTLTVYLRFEYQR